jgi:hypothetical protein
MRAQVDVGIAEERQDRVIERGCGQLDLPAAGRLAIFGDDAVQDLELHLAKYGLVLLRELSFFVEKRADAAVVVLIQRVDPRELVPDLQIAEIVDAEPRRGDPSVLRRRHGAATAREELRIARMHLDHVLPLRVKEVLEDEIDVAVIEFRRGLHAQLEITVLCASLGERLQLHQQRRHEIEGHPDARELAQERHHAVVVLQRMQPDPRQDVLAGDEVLVIRLVHVPHEGDARHTV